MVLIKDKEGVTWVCSLPTKMSVAIGRVFGQTKFPIVRLRPLKTPKK